MSGLSGTVRNYRIFFKLSGKCHSKTVIFAMSGKCQGFLQAWGNVIAM